MVGVSGQVTQQIERKIMLNIQRKTVVERIAPNTTVIERKLLSIEERNGTINLESIVLGKCFINEPQTSNEGVELVACIHTLIAMA